MISVPILFWSQVQNSSANMDFLSVTNNVLFPDGSASEQGSMIVINDAIPEGNETFLLRITETRFGADIGAMDTMLLTIQASDEPFGKFQFNEVNALDMTVHRSFSLFYNLGPTELFVGEWQGTHQWHC